VAIGLNPVLVMHTVGGAHNDALIALCFAGGFVLAIRAARADRGPHASRTGSTLWVQGLLATLLLTLAVLIKAVVAPLLVLWLWQVWRGGAGRTGRAARLATHMGVVVGATIAAFIPVQAGWSTVRALLSVTSRQGWASGPGLVARGGRALGRAIGGSAAGVVLESAISAGFAVLFLWLFWRLLRRSTATPDADVWGGTVLLLALAAPYLLPWYAAWFVPFLALMRDQFLRAAGFAAAGLLALTGIPAEGGSAPRLWSHMVLAVHYVAAPVMLGLLGFVAWRVMRLTGPLPKRAPVPEAPTPGRT
jgi:alpha-1,6-mannosyltransferase